MQEEATTPSSPKLTKSRPGLLYFDNKQDWEEGRRRFIVTASIAGKLVNCGQRSTRNELLKTQSLKLLMRSIPEKTHVWTDLMPKINDYTQWIMDKGTANEALIHQKVNPHLTKEKVDFMIVHPMIPWMACSPDAVDWDAGIGHEYKTLVVKTTLPLEVHQIDHSHYLQVQTSLACSAHLGLTRWTLTHNKLGFEETSTFMIDYDPGLMDYMQQQYFQPFVNKVAKIYAQTCRPIYRLNSEGDQPTDDMCKNWFETAYNAHKYGPMNKDERDAITFAITDSIDSHVTHVLPVTLK